MAHWALRKRARHELLQGWPMKSLEDIRIAVVHSLFLPRCDVLSLEAAVPDHWRLLRVVDIPARRE